MKNQQRAATGDSTERDRDIYKHAPQNQVKSASTKQI